MRLLLHDGDRVTELEATERAGEVLIERAGVREATGWSVEDHGLCRGDVCRPARLGHEVTLSELADLLGRPLACSDAHQGEVLAVLGEPAGSTVASGSAAPPLTLRDPDGDEQQLTGRETGRKTVVVAWSTWCGCRYELPSWRELADELRPRGLDLMLVALDDDADRVRHWSDKGKVSSAIDPAHRLSDVFGIVNVPSTVWLDEQDRVVKAPTIAPGDDRFHDFTEVGAAGHHEALRRWVDTGEVPEVEAAGDDEDLRTARARRRLAVALHDAGRTDEAEEHFAAAVALAPLDFSIRRSAMRRRGQDPFGTEFFTLWEEWSAAGRPGYRATVSEPETSPRSES